MLRITSAVLLSAALLVLGCDSSDPDTNLPDSFTGGQGGITVSGGVTSSFVGTAYWSVFDYDDEFDEPGFVLLILNGNLVDVADGLYEGVVVTGNTTRPAPGSYALTDFIGDDAGLYEAIYVRSTAEVANFIISEGGSLTITGSNNQRVEGTVNFSGTIYTMAGPMQAEGTVSGGFNAQFVDPEDVPEDAGRMAAVAETIMSEFAR